MYGCVPSIRRELKMIIIFYDCFWLPYIFRKHFLRRPSADILQTFPRDVTFATTEKLPCRFPERSTKINGAKPGQPVPPISVPVRSKLSVVVRRRTVCRRKSKTVVSVTSYFFVSLANRRRRVSMVRWYVLQRSSHRRYYSLAVADLPIFRL